MDATSAANPYNIPPSIQIPIYDERVKKTIQFKMPREFLLKHINEAFAQRLPCLIAVETNRNMTPEGPEISYEFVQAHKFSKELISKQRAKPEYWQYFFLMRTTKVDNVATALFHPINNEYTGTFINNFFSDFYNAAGGDKINISSQLRATTQYCLALRFKNGGGVPQSLTEAFNFALMAANEGLVEAKNLAKSLTRDYLPTFPPNESFFTGGEVNNVTLVFRELIARLPQPAVVRDFKIEPKLNPKEYTSSEGFLFKSRLGGGPTIPEKFCYKIKFDITAVVETPEGKKEIRRIHRHEFFPSEISSGPDDEGRCYKITCFQAKHWGIEIKAALLPTDSLHEKLKPYTDALNLLEYCV